MAGSPRRRNGYQPPPPTGSTPLFTRAAGEGSHLAVVTGAQVDTNLIGVAMQIQAAKLTAAYRDGPLRPFVLTGGRARPPRNTIGVDALLAANPVKTLPISASRQERTLVGLCRRLLSVVEAAAYLKLPVGVVAVLASDLVDSGHLTVRSSPSSQAHSEWTSPDRELLAEVLDGPRRLRCPDG